MQGKTTKKHDKNGQIAFFKIFELFILIIWAKDVPLKYLSPYIIVVPLFFSTSYVNQWVLTRNHVWEYS